MKTVIFTLSLDCIANMPCNPCIGGSAKGQIVCEIDSLGGEMGRAADATFIQSRMLNREKDQRCTVSECRVTALSITPI